MENVTMCKPERCKLKMNCERFIRKYDQVQLYFIKEPCDQEGVSCLMYLKKL